MAKPIVFEDIFEVLATDPGGKHFDKGADALTTFGCHCLLIAAVETGTTGVQ